MTRKKRGKITIPAGCYPLPHEIHTVNILAKHGEDVCFILPKNTYKSKNADIIFRNLVWEIKAPEGKIAGAIERNLKRACRQSENIIFDCYRMKNVPNFVIRRELEKRATIQKKIKHLIMIDKSEKLIDIK